MKAVAVSAITLGLVLVLLSGAWITLFPGTSSWTPDKAEKWMKVKDRLHTLGFAVGRNPGPVSMHSGTETGQAKVEYDELVAENATLTAEFQSVYDRPRVVAKVLKWSGISLAAIGIIGLYAVNQRS